MGRKLRILLFLLCSFSLSYTPTYSQGWNSGFFVQAERPPFSFGNALQFDGVNDFVETSINIPITGNNARTINVWVKTTASTFGLIGLGLNSTSNRFQIWHSGVLTYILLGSGNVAVGNSNLRNGNWHMLTVTHDGSTLASGIKIYMDGVLIHTSTSVQPVNTSLSVLTIGKLNGGQNDYFTGDLDEVGIWNTALTAGEIANLYNSGNGDFATNYQDANLIAYYRMDEADGSTTLIDEKGTYNGTLNNFSTPPAYFIPH